MTGTACELVERVLRAGRERDVETFVALMAPDGYLEWPYRPPGVPARVQGRTAIREHLTQVAGADYVNPLPLLEVLAGITGAVPAGM